MASAAPAPRTPSCRRSAHPVIPRCLTSLARNLEIATSHRDRAMVQRYPTPRSPPPARRSSLVSITSRSGSSSSKRHTQAEAATPSPHRRLDLGVRCPDPADMRPRRGESQTTEPGYMLSLPASTLFDFTILIWFVSKVPAVMVVAAGVLLPSSCRSVSLKGIKKGRGITTSYYTQKNPTEGTPHENSYRRNTVCTMIGEVAKERNFSKACWRRRLESSVSEMVGEVAKEGNFSKACWRRRLESSVSGCSFTQDFSFSIYSPSFMLQKGHMEGLGWFFYLPTAISLESFIVIFQKSHMEVTTSTTLVLQGAQL
ncbi:uncharacterized protein [Miscanthus floridulus]|uniref:uncharacterized protein isoform X2 n=1 Tax=Miscanthus floridulus TaxID=154761 RepID=UPI0034574A95